MENQCHRVAVQVQLPEDRVLDPLLNVKEDTYPIVAEPHDNADNVGQILDKYPEVQHNAADPEGKQHFNQKHRDNPEDIPGQGYPVEYHQSYDNYSGEQHLAEIDAHFFNDEYKLRQIDFVDNTFVFLDYLNAGIQCAVEKIPKRKTDKNKQRKVLFLRMEHIPEDNRVNYHHTERIENPPQPVQIGSGNFCFQSCLRGVFGIMMIFPGVLKKSF